MEAFVKATKTKMKRKDLDQVNDDFSDFSLSSPARKIRRLDAELPPIMEDEDPEVLMSFDQPSPEVQPARADAVMEEFSPSSSPVNEERAIILFKPVNSPILQHQSPSMLSVSVDPDLISGFRNHYVQAALSRSERSSYKDTEAADSNRNKCTAVVPWVANQFTLSMEPQAETSSEMEAEETEQSTMEMEDSTPAEELPNNQYTEEIKESDASGLPHWQQHCMTPQLPPSSSSPIVWFR